MNSTGEVGLAALRKLTQDERAVARCDERLLEKLQRRVLNDVPTFSSALTGGRLDTWHPGAAGWLPDLMAEDQGEHFLAGLEVKTRAHINWGWYGTENWHSQLDRYTQRVDEIGGEGAPLFLVVTHKNKSRVDRELAATGEARIASASRWTVLSLDELLERAPAPASPPHASTKGPAVDLLASLLSER